jgi:DNA-binding MarR family transcriptional regulator
MALDTHYNDDHYYDDHHYEQLAMPKRPSDSRTGDQGVTAPLNSRPYTIHFGPGVAPVRRTLGALTRRVHQLSMAMTADAIAEADLTPMQYGAMGCLNKKDGEPGIDQSGLAARLGVDRNSASVLVENLVAKGLIERRMNETDRRVRLLELTSKGERLFLQVRQRNLAAQARTLEMLAPQEREQLLELLTRVIAANGQHARPGVGRRKRGWRQLPSNKKG